MSLAALRVRLKEKFIRESDMDQLIADADVAIGKLDALAKLGAWVLAESRREFGDLDGGDIQDKAVELGLLAPVKATEPCGDGCVCAEYDDFPQTCLRLTALANPEE